MLRTCGPLLFVFACGGSHSASPSPQGPSCDAQDGNQSGTQLKIAWLASHDGTCVVTGVVDSKNDGACTPAPWSDGNSYCTFAGAADALFAGNSCANLLDGTGTSQGSALTPVVARDAQGRITDEWSTATHSVDIKVVDAVSTRDASGACNSVADCHFENCSGIPLTYSSGGAHAARMDLVQATTSAFGSDRYQPLFTQGTDGLQAQASIEAFDAMLNIDCVPRTFGSTTVCEPVGIAEPTSFLDAACTQAVLWNPSPTARFWRQSSACSTDLPRYLETAGVIVAPAQIYSRDSTGACVGTSAAPSGTYVSLVDIDLSVQRAADADPAHRLHIIHLASEPQWRDTGLFDSELGTECSIATARDGALRCLPTSPIQAVGDLYYSDSLCAHLATVGVALPAAGCGAIENPHYALGPDHSVWTVAGASSWHALYWQSREDPYHCLPACDVFPNGCPDGQVFELSSQPLDDGQFAELVPTSE